MPAWDPAANDLFLRALEVSAAEDRQRFLDEACAGDAALRARVDALLRAGAEAGSFLDRPAEGLAATSAHAARPPDERSAGPAEGPGTVIGPYKLIEPIGEGGMGTVYMAQQAEPVKRLVALKLIKPGMDSKQVLARFEAERQALALMDHPNIAKVFDGGTTKGEPGGVCPGRPYFVMELVKGVPLTKYCDEHRLTPRQRLELFVPICQAIQHAHQKGIIHRDIKPSNVLVASYDGKPVPKVIDFGIAKATGQQLSEHTLVTGFGNVVGTLEYMSPEQAEFNQLDIDTRSDIYSLGVLLYELLTGTTPLEKKRLKEAAMLEVLRIIREEEPPRPSTRLSTTEQLPSIAANRGLEPKKLSGLVRGELDWIVMKALDKDRNRRYETANGFAMDVQRYLADEPVQACPPSAWYRLRKFARRNKARLTIAAGLFLAMTMIKATLGWAVRDRAAREAEIAQAETARRARVADRVREGVDVARTLVAENKLAAARQKLAEARAQLGNDQSALADLAAEVETGAADLDRLQQFLDLMDQAHQAESSPIAETGPGPPSSPKIWERRPAAAVPFFLQALRRYEVLERDEWHATLAGSLLGREQVKQIRRQAYEALVWLADDVIRRREEHRSGGKLSSAAAARAALVYLGKAESAHRPTQFLYGLRARCRKDLGEEAAYRADVQLFNKTPPTMALDHHLWALFAYRDKELVKAVQACEAALRVEPTHYWSMMTLGTCLNDLGQGPEDFVQAVRVYTGCILKRPEHAGAYRRRGNSHYRLRRYEEAIADYSRAIALDPKLRPAWFQRGHTYGMLKQFDKAVADSTRAIELDPKEALAWYNRGCFYHELKQDDKAVTDYSQAIALDPKYVLAWNNRGIVYLDLRQYDKAVADFTKAIELDPKHAAAWYNRGLAHSVLGQHSKGIVDYSQAIALDPKYVLAWSNRGAAYFKLGQYHKALADCSQAIKLDPKCASAWSGRGNAYSKLGQYDQAIADHCKAIAVDPKNVQAWYNRGHTYGMLEQFDKAVADYSRAIELDPKLAEAWRNRGLAYIGLGQPEKAIADSSRAIELNSKDPFPWSNRSIAYRQLGRLDRALADSSHAIELSPKFAEAWCNRGAAYRKLGQYARAVTDYSRGVELGPKNAVAWNERGSAYHSLKHYDKAVADYSKAIELDQKYKSAWGNRASAYHDLRQYDKAVADYSKVIELSPKLAEAWHNRGLAYAQLGQYDKAVADYSRAIELAPKNAFAWNRRGCLYCDHLGQPEKAVADFSRTIDLEPKNAAHWANRGNAYSKLGQYERALADYSRAIDLDTMFAAAWTGRGNTFRDLSQPEKAVADYSRAIDLDPKNAFALSGRGSLYCDYLGQPEKALADFSKCIELDPKNAAHWYNRGNAYHALAQYEKAVADYSKAIKLNPKYVEAWASRGLTYFYLGHHDKALADLSHATEINPKHVFNWITRGWIYSNLGQYDKAVADYRTALELAPAHAGAHNELAWLLATCPDAKRRDPKRAVEHAKKAVQLAPKDANNWGTLGTANYRAGDWKAAVAALDKALELREGEHPSNWFFLAMAHRKLGNEPLSRKAYDQALQWLEKNQEKLAKDKAPQADEIRRIREEAEEVLELKKK